MRQPPLKGAIIGRSAQPEKAFSELNERWLQKTKHTIRIQHGPIADLKPSSQSTFPSMHSTGTTSALLQWISGLGKSTQRGYTLQRMAFLGTLVAHRCYEFCHPRPDKDKAIPIYQTAAGGTHCGLVRSTVRGHAHNGPWPAHRRSRFCGLETRASPPFDVASCSHIVEAHFNTDPLQTIFALGQRCTPKAPIQHEL